MVLKTLMLTYVLYEDTAVDKALALLTFLPFVVLIGLCALALCNRCLESAFACVGLLCSTAANLALKQLIKQPRPPGSHRADFGMPSDHSQFMAFWGVYVVCWLCLSKRVHISARAKWVYSSLACVSVPIVMYSRVRLGVHSVEQVLVGALVGVLLGGAWHALGEKFVRNVAFPRFARCALGRFLLLKDSGCTPNVQLVEREVALVLSTLNKVTAANSALAPPLSSEGGAAISPEAVLLTAVGIDAVAWDALLLALESVPRCVPSSCNVSDDRALLAAALAYSLVRVREAAVAKRE